MNNNNMTNLARAKACGADVAYVGPDPLEAYITLNVEELDAYTAQAIAEAKVVGAVPLSDDQIADLWDAQLFHITDLAGAIDLVRDVEAAHGIGTQGVES